MTTHHTIELTATSTFIRVTYRAGKFKKLEHLRGTLNQEMLNHIGRIIPIQENELANFIKLYKDKVRYTQEIKQKSIYQLFNQEWFDFYIKLTRFAPKFTGADGRALKQIIAYLKSISTSEQEALTIWQQLLANWHTLSQFHQKNTDLKYINSQLNKLLQNVKANNTNPEQVFTNAVHSETGKHFKFK